MEFDFSELENVKENFEHSFTGCNNQHSIGGDSELEGTQGADSLIFSDFFIYNVFSFLINLAMTVMISSIVISLLKHKTYQEQKMKKYIWLLRNRKEFLGKVSPID